MLNYAHLNCKRKATKAYILSFLNTPQDCNEFILGLTSQHTGGSYDPCCLLRPLLIVKINEKLTEQHQKYQNKDLKERVTSFQIQQHWSICTLKEIVVAVTDPHVHTGKQISWVSSKVFFFSMKFPFCFHRLCLLAKPRQREFCTKNTHSVCCSLILASAELIKD